MEGAGAVETGLIRSVPYRLSAPKLIVCPFRSTRRACSSIVVMAPMGVYLWYVAKR